MSSAPPLQAPLEVNETKIAELQNRIEDLQRQHPGVDVADPFTRGYQRGREYYQHLCETGKAA